MTAISFPKVQIPLLINGDKMGTLRKPTFKINPDLSLKFISNRKFGVFAEVDTFKISPFDISKDLNGNTAHLLGYNTPKEYLDNNDWGVTGNKRILIEWDYNDLKINWGATNPQIN